MVWVPLQYPVLPQASYPMNMNTLRFHLFRSCSLSEDLVKSCVRGKGENGGHVTVLQ